MAGSRVHYLDEVFGVRGKGGVEHEVVEVGVLLRAVVVEVDKVLDVIVGAKVTDVLEREKWEAKSHLVPRTVWQLALYIISYDFPRDHTHLFLS